jgi:gliding motility-associated-like protein
LQPLAVAADIIVPACGVDGGSIALDVIGGTAPYNYTWSHDAALNGPLAGNLSSGNYSITIVDANQCSLNEFYTLSSPAPLSAQLDSLHHVTCFGANNGELFLTVNGGTAPYQYDWGTGLQSALAPFAAGTYSMEIRDAAGCEATLNFTITQPEELIASLVTEDASCFGLNDGRIIASVEGGMQPYAYTWSNGANQATNANLTAGNYSLSLTDANGCTSVVSALVSQPDALAIELLSENPGCNSNTSGSISALVSGGVEGYSFIWNTGSTSNEINGLSSGAYEVQVTDANACTAQAEVTLVSGAAFSVFIEGDTSICKGEQTVLTATTNLPHAGYSISWGHGVNTEMVVVNPAEDDVYTVVFTDSLGCSENASVTVHVNPIPAIGISSSVMEGCAPVCTKLVAPAGSESYDWSFTDGRTAEGVDPTVCFENAGIYGVSLSVSDSNGCSAQMTWTETIEVFAAPVAAFTANPSEISLDEPNVNFTSQSEGADSYTYFFGDPANNYVMAPSAQHAYSDTGSFEVTLVVTNEHGCKDEAVRTIHVGGFTAFYIPNAFSPDGDGTNDVFMPKASGLSGNGYEMQIFDRWGNLIFVTTDWDKGWDGTYMGKEVQSGQYVCKVKYFDNKGFPTDQIGSVIVTE